MTIYNSKSRKAEEFICHEEIEKTLKYAAENKDDTETMKKILERAKDCKGLSYKEAALLLECEDKEIHEELSLIHISVLMIGLNIVFLTALDLGIGGYIPVSYTHLHCSEIHFTSKESKVKVKIYCCKKSV